MHCIYRLLFIALSAEIDPFHFHVSAWSVPQWPVSNQASVTSINALRLMDEALQRSQDGVVHLEIPTSGQPSHLSILPVGFTVVREPEGVNVTLPCGDIRTVELPLIRYNGRQLSPESGRLEEVMQRLYVCRCNVSPPNNVFDSGLALLAEDPFLPTYFIQLYNFASHLSGTYECLHRVYGVLTVTNRYLISPRLLPQEVFNPPMMNVTAKVGEKAEFRCAVKFNTMPSERMAFETRFMWRNDQGLIFAPGVPAFQHDVRMKSGINVTSNVPEDCLCHSTLSLESVQSQDAGRYQCWFKINDIFDEWVVQSAYLHAA
ncbi:uncharacterized protein LOC129598188 [Paramacrobiotus metropolitanus]|uniref:uncharacterized protein LOC129598188 n=1 Tax=Paramacrobiotus metropolitanus TaxID=2943436 RepID=UPI0024461F97|nr:uncharacterized protein LOC129598188 [Paramacrobiotus metropolitanus]